MTQPPNPPDFPDQDDEESLDLAELSQEERRRYLKNLRTHKQYQREMERRQFWADARTYLLSTGHGLAVLFLSVAILLGVTVLLIQHFGWPDFGSSQQNTTAAPAQTAAPTPTAPAATESDLVTAALRAFQQKQFSEAAAMLRQSEQLRPLSAQAVLLLALCHAALGENDQAEPLFSRATELNSNDPEAWFQWGEFLRRLDRPGEAVKKLATAVDLRPDNPIYRTKWGIARSENGEFITLFPEVQQMIYVDPPPGDWTMIMAAICLDYGNVPEGVRMLQIARTRLPQNEFRLLLYDPLFLRFSVREGVREIYQSVMPAPGQVK